MFLSVHVLYIQSLKNIDENLLWLLRFRLVKVHFIWNSSLYDAVAFYSTTIPALNILLHYSTPHSRRRVEQDPHIHGQRGAVRPWSCDTHPTHNQARMFPAEKICSSNVINDRRKKKKEDVARSAGVFILHVIMHQRCLASLAKSGHCFTSDWVTTKWSDFSKLYLKKKNAGVKTKMAWSRRIDLYTARLGATACFRIKTRVRVCENNSCLAHYDTSFTGWHTDIFKMWLLPSFFTALLQPFIQILWQHLRKLRCYYH